MVNDIAIAEELVMLDKFGRLALKSDVAIEVGSHVILINGIEFPRKMFTVLPGDATELVLKLNEPCRMQAGMRLPHGTNAFHHCISSGSAEYFIPEAYFSERRL